METARARYPIRRLESVISVEVVSGNCRWDHRWTRHTDDKTQCAISSGFHPWSSAPVCVQSGKSLGQPAGINAELDLVQIWV